MDDYSPELAYSILKSQPLNKVWLCIHGPFTVNLQDGPWYDVRNAKGLYMWGFQQRERAEQLADMLNEKYATWLMARGTPAAQEI